MRFDDSKKKSLLKMTTQDRELLDDVTHQMDILKILTAEISSEEAIHEDAEMTDPKRSRNDVGLFTKHLQERKGFFDPLLFLRTKSSHTQPEAVVRESRDPEAAELPSFEEIMGVSTKPLLVEPAKRLLKPVRRVDQEKKEPPKTLGPKLPVAVYRFCQNHSLAYQTLKISRTFRSIIFGRSRSKADTSDPWEDYIDLNNLSRSQLCHALYFGFCMEGQSDEGRVVAIVPHTSKSQGETDVERIRVALDAVSVRRISLTHMEKELGFPTFVCPPFGHEFAPNLHKNGSNGLTFTTVIDSSLLSENCEPCVFDLGMVAIRIHPSELSRISRGLNWLVLENLVKRHFQ